MSALAHWSLITIPLAHQLLRDQASGLGIIHCHWLGLLLLTGCLLRFLENISMTGVFYQSVHAERVFMLYFIFDSLYKLSVLTFIYLFLFFETWFGPGYPGIWPHRDLPASFLSTRFKDLTSYFMMHFWFCFDVFTSWFIYCVLNILYPLKLFHKSKNLISCSLICRTQKYSICQSK